MRIVFTVVSLFMLTVLQGCTSFKVGLRPFPEESELKPFSQVWASAVLSDQAAQEKDLAAYSAAAIKANAAAQAVTQAEANRESASVAAQKAKGEVSSAMQSDLSTAENVLELNKATVLVEEQILNIRKSDALDRERRVKLLRREVAVYAADVYKRAKERSALAWEANEMATFGGLGAVVGGIASKTGLINSGAAVAAVGLTNSQFYKLETQRQSYTTALKRLTCISAKMALITQQDLDRASQSSNIGAGATAAVNFESTVVNQVDTVRMEYTNALLGIAPAELDRAALEAITGKFKLQNNSAPGEKSKGVGANSEANDAAATKVKEAYDAVLLCART